MSTAWVRPDILCALALLLAVGGCGGTDTLEPAAVAGGSSGGAATGGASGTPGGTGGSSSSVPANIDLNRCASVKDVGTTEGSSACYDCCFRASFTASGFYLGACACAMPIDDSGNLVCAQHTDNPDNCSACCLAQDFSGMKYSSNPGGYCNCYNRFLAEPCPLGSESTAPEAACASCCVSRGFVGHLNSAAGCLCSGG